MVFEILIAVATRNRFTWIVDLFREYTNDSEIYRIPYTSIASILRPKIADFVRSSGPGTGSTQRREYN
jgi:hypothetical protein